MQGLADNLKRLEGDLPATRRVLDWAFSAFLPSEPRSSLNVGLQGATMHAVGTVTPPAGSVSVTGHAPIVNQSSVWETLPELYSVASPNSDADRALVVAYFLQKVKGSNDLDSFSINKELRHLGYAASNITSALNSLIARKPQYAIQTHKSGNSKQARKRYRLTNDGLRAVERMLEGGANS